MPDGLLQQEFLDESGFFLRLHLNGRQEASVQRGMRGFDLPRQSVVIRLH